VDIITATRDGSGRLKHCVYSFKYPSSQERGVGWSAVVKVDFMEQRVLRLSPPDSKYSSQV